MRTLERLQQTEKKIRDPWKARVVKRKNKMT